MVVPAEFFDLSHDEVRRLFNGIEAVWEILPRLGELTANLLAGRRIIKGTVMPGAVVDDGPVFIGDGARVEPGVYVQGPAYVGPGVTLRHGAYLREDCILLAGSVVGHASEVKSSLLLPEAKAPHFAYVGDSVLGHRVNLGAGSKLSNLAVTSARGEDGSRPTVKIPAGDRMIDTGLDKIGAVLGDDVQIGCNAVLNPGTLLGPRCLVYPNATVAKGWYPADRILKLRQVIEVDIRRPAS